MRLKFFNCFIALAIGVIFCANAQKLPTVQPTSLRAPANIKIDGKATEWNNFQAYNNATNIFYSISNDDNNLYLTVQSPERDIIKRILNGAITFTIHPDGNKKSSNGIAITYPVISPKIMTNFNSQPKIIPGSESSVAKADSFMNAFNKRMTDRIKYIKVTGIKTLDTLISVYNNDGIKAAALFDNKMVYTWELAVSLKHLGLSVNSPAKLAYNIKVNGVYIAPPTTVADATGAQTTVVSGFSMASPPQDATDFWGDYLLIK